MTRPVMRLDPRHVEAAARAQYESASKAYTRMSSASLVAWDDLPLNVREESCKQVAAGISAFIRVWL